jgi:hypothetical protein
MSSNAAAQVSLVLDVAKNPIERKKFIDDPIAFGARHDVSFDEDFARESARRLREVQERIDTLGGKDFSESHAEPRPQFLLAILAAVAVATAVVDAATSVYHALTKQTLQ